MNGQTHTCTNIYTEIEKERHIKLVIYGRRMFCSCKQGLIKVSEFLFSTVHKHLKASKLNILDYGKILHYLDDVKKAKLN